MLLVCIDTIDTFQVVLGTHSSVHCYEETDEALAALNVTKMSVWSWFHFFWWSDFYFLLISLPKKSGDFLKTNMNRGMFWVYNELSVLIFFDLTNRPDLETCFVNLIKKLSVYNKIWCQNSKIYLGDRSIQKNHSWKSSVHYRGAAGPASVWFSYFEHL